MKKYLVYFGLAFMFTACQHNPIQEKALSKLHDKEVYPVMATVTVKPEYLEKFVNETLPLIKASRSEKGTLVYQLHQSKENPHVFMWYEHFKDKKAFDDHVASPEVAAWFPGLKQMAAIELKATPFKMIESRSDIKLSSEKGN